MNNHKNDHKFSRSSSRDQDYKNDKFERGSSIESSQLNKKRKRSIESSLHKQNKSEIFTPGLDIPLVSISLFSDLQNGIIEKDILEKAYSEYKSNYENKKFYSFFLEHKDEEWFKEKYDEELSLKVKLERKLQCNKLAEKFYSTDFTGLNLTLKEEDENNRSVKILIYGFNSEKKEFEEKERDISLLLSKQTNESQLNLQIEPYFGYDPDKYTLFLHHIPKEISRFVILDVLKKLPGFIFMSLSEPIKNQNYSRYCWVTFDSEDNCDLAHESLNDYKITNDFKINTIKSKATTMKRVRVTPNLFDERIEEDLVNTKLFIEKFDKEYGVEVNPLLGKNLAPENQLDLQILYLRRVYGFCFYCLEEYEDERLLSTKCDNIHLRHNKSLGKRSLSDSFDINFGLKIKEKLNENSIHTKDIKEEVTKKRNDYCFKQVESISLEKHECKLCKKLFKGANYVINHIINKHLEVVQDKVDKEIYDKLKYDNYVKDQAKANEKYKVIQSMEDYTYFLNSVKNGTNINSNDKKRFSKERRPYTKRDYKDYDNPKPQIAQNSQRKLISYDDL